MATDAAASRMDQPDEEDMGHPIDDHFDVLTTADELAAMREELRNANALSEKLQSLVDSKTHQVEALHKEIDAVREKLYQAQAQRETIDDEGAEPDLETVRLDVLLDAVQMFVDDGQQIVIGSTAHPISVRALGLEFEVETEEVAIVLEHAQALQRRINPIA